MFSTVFRHFQIETVFFVGREYFHYGMIATGDHGYLYRCTMQHPADQVGPPWPLFFETVKTHRSGGAWDFQKTEIRHYYTSITSSASIRLARIITGNLHGLPVWFMSFHFLVSDTPTKKIAIHVFITQMARKLFSEIIILLLVPIIQTILQLQELKIIPVLVLPLVYPCVSKE